MMLRRLDEDSADDLAQETFIAAWRAAASWRGECSYFTWLARIAWRQFLSRRRREQPVEPLKVLEEPAVEADGPRRTAIAQAMSRLSDSERMAALLCFAQGYPHREAALIMDIPLGTLKSSVARARGKLIHCLEDEQ